MMQPRCAVCDGDNDVMTTDITGTIADAIAALPPEEQALVALYGRWFDEEVARWPRGANGHALTRGQRITAAKRRARVVTLAKGSKRHG